MHKILITVFVIISLVCIFSCQKEAAQDSVQLDKDVTENIASNKDIAKAEAEKIAPPPSDPEEKRAWLRDVAKKIPETPTNISISQTGVGTWKACMSEEEIRSSKGMRLCPDTQITSKSRCFTTYLTTKKDSSPLELWSREGVLSRIVIRSDRFATPQGVKIGDPLIDLLGLYNYVKYLRGDNQEWIVAVPQLNSHFYLADNKAENENKLDRFVKINKIEVHFKCEK